MLSFSFVPSLSVKHKHLKLHSRPCNESTHPLGDQHSSPSPPALILWFMPLSQLPCSKGESSSNNEKSWQPVWDSVPITSPTTGALRGLGA